MSETQPPSGEPSPTPENASPDQSPPDSARTELRVLSTTIFLVPRRYQWDQNENSPSEHTLIVEIPGPDGDTVYATDSHIFRLTRSRLADLARDIIESLERMPPDDEDAQPVGDL